MNTKGAAGSAANAPSARSGPPVVSQLRSDDTTPAAGRQRPAHGRIVGRVWRKKVSESIHMLRKPKPAWAVDLADLKAAEACGVTEVEIHEKERGVIYRVSLLTLKTKGTVFQRGRGQQVSLPLGYWTTSGGEPATPPPEPAQQRLF